MASRQTANELQDELQLYHIHSKIVAREDTLPIANDVNHPNFPVDLALIAETPEDRGSPIVSAVGTLTIPGKG